MSLVQTEALKVRIMQADMKERERRLDGINLALLTHDPSSLSLLFPDLFPAQPMTEAQIDQALSGEVPVIVESVSVSEAQQMLTLLGNTGALDASELIFGDTDA
jgi:hypothetical protein